MRESKKWKVESEKPGGGGAFHTKARRHEMGRSEKWKVESGKRQPAQPRIALSNSFSLSTFHFSLSSPSRSGIALIMALGVLSLLILIVTAFTISMRVEHLAARNARDKVRSRHYLHAAQALATETIGACMVQQLAPGGDWYRFLSVPATGDSEMDALLSTINPDLVAPLDWEATTNGPCMASLGYLVPGNPPLVSGLATNLLPPSVRETAQAMPVGWTYIVTTNAFDGSDRMLAGRVAFLAVDLTGTLDVHHVTTNQFCDLAAVEPTDPTLSDFFADRTAHRRYETISELPGNRGIYADDGQPLVASAEFAAFLDALGTYSYDPNPDQLLHYNDGYGPGDLGTTTLTNKFNLNSITNSFNGDLPDPASSPQPVRFYTEFDDADGYFAAISNAVFNVTPAFPVTNAAKAVYWNLLNYLDADRLPQTDTDHPWLDNYGVEAVPLINELVVELAEASAGENRYATSVELWHPFAPSPSPSNTRLEAALFTKTHALDAFEAMTSGFTPFTDWVSVTNADSTVTPVPVAVANGFRADIVAVDPQPFPDSLPAGFTNNVETMQYPEAQFRTFEAPEPFAFPVEVTNAVGGVETRWLPIGPASYVTHVPVADPVGGGIVYVPRTNHVVNTLSLCIRVAVADHAVDEAPGPREDVPSSPGPWYVSVTNTVSISVTDPRWNGRIGYWSDQPSTLDAPNTAFSEGVAMFQGLPILHRDGLLRSVGEIGYLGTGTRWQSLNLFAAPAAKLLDLWTVRDIATNGPQWAQGRIHAFTEYPAAIRAMFADTEFGTNRFAAAATGVPSAPQTAVEYPLVLDALTDAVLLVRPDFQPQPTAQADGTKPLLPFTQWLPLLNNAAVTGGELKLAWDNYGDDDLPGYDLPGHDLLEDLIRDLPERVSFRQNLFLVFLRAQTLARSGRVTADSASAVLIVRDAYTGAWAIRHVLSLH